MTLFLYHLMMLVSVAHKVRSIRSLLEDVQFMTGHSPEKLYFLSLRNNQLPITVSWFWHFVGTSPMHAVMLSGIPILGLVQTNTAVISCMDSLVMSRSNYFKILITYYWILKSLCHSCIIFLKPREEVMVLILHSWLRIQCPFILFILTVLVLNVDLLIQ